MKLFKKLINEQNKYKQTQKKRNKTVRSRLYITKANFKSK